MTRRDVQVAVASAIISVLVVIVLVFAFGGFNLASNARHTAFPVPTQ